MECIGASGVRAGLPSVEMEARPASHVSNELVEEAMDVGKGPQSPASINNGVGLGLLDEEVGEDGSGSQPCSPTFMRAQPQPVTSQPADRFGNNLAESVEGPVNGVGINRRRGGAASNVPHSAAEALQALADDSHGGHSTRNFVTGVPSQHRMATRDPLRSDEAADLLMGIREAEVQNDPQLRTVDSLDDTDGKPKASFGCHLASYKSRPCLSQIQAAGC